MCLRLPIATIAAMANTVLLIDAYAIIYRAFYAIPTLTAPNGQPVNAVFGFIKMIRKAMADHKATHAAVVFDLGPPRKRLDLLPAYKEQRPPTPPDLESQFDLIRRSLDALRLTVIERDGEEADDLIATLAHRAAARHDRVVILSSDKDFLQLVNDHIRLARPDGKESVMYDAAKVRERYGVEPSQIVDYLSLVGDSVDNISGVPGVGPKTAVALLQEHRDIDSLLENAASISKLKLRESLLSHAMRTRLNRRIIRLDTAIDMDIDLDNLHVAEPDTERLKALCRDCGFKTMLAEIERTETRQGDLFG